MRPMLMKATRSRYKIEPMDRANVKTMNLKHACGTARSRRGRGQKQSLVVTRVVAAAIGALVCVSVPAAAQFTQQGNKLVGSGAVGSANQGYSVALSHDGDTTIVGGPYDNSEIGAAWVFTRGNGVWAQQGPKLVGNDAAGMSIQGSSVALSADGNTAIMGGRSDNADVGAAWVFTRSNGVWTQQGNKLVGSVRSGGLSRLLGRAFRRRQYSHRRRACDDNGAGRLGAAWVFTRSNGVWTQQGNKLVGTGAVGAAHQGSLSLFPPTAIPPSWAARATTGNRRGVGLHAQQRSLDPAGRQTGR